jgi:hypothetical protein
MQNVSSLLEDVATAAPDIGRLAGPVAAHPDRKDPDMNRHPLVTPHRTQYGALADMQRSAWRRAIGPQRPRLHDRSTVSRWRRTAVIVGRLVGVVMPLAGTTAFVFAGDRASSRQPLPSLDERYAEAVQALHAQHHAHAYGRFAGLADLDQAASEITEPEPVDARPPGVPCAATAANGAS